MTEPRPPQAIGRSLREWNPENTERLLVATHRRIRRSNQRRAVMSVAAVLAMGIFVLFFTRPSRWRKPDVTHVAVTPAPSQLRETESRVTRLEDGSSVRLLDAQSEVPVVEESSDGTTLEVRHGGGRFTVTPQHARQFVVRAGLVTVKVVGTEFVVQRRDERTWVAVTHGRVQVNWPDHEQILDAGEQGLFPPAENLDDAGTRVRAPSAEGKVAGDAFHTRAARHEYAEAFALMQATPTVVGRTADDLMLAADVARLSGHPAQAVPFLERVLREHEKDPRAALAAFTLGRTLLGLGQAQAASRAFARVAVLAPSSPLVEDALARQVEAAARGGDQGMARKLARRYLETYPNGRRAAAVRENAGLE